MHGETVRSDHFQLPH